MKMTRQILVLALGVFHVASSVPVLTLQDLDPADDLEPVGSYVREVRAAPPDYHKSYENEGDGEIGYSRKKQGGGKKGYQHFDSFHKKAGDNYEFEKQDSFGHDGDAEEGAHSHRHEQRERPDGHEAEYVEPEVEAEYERYKEEPERESYEDDRKHKIEGKKNKKAHQQKEKHYEELKEAASDGNGGVEAIGHDPRDYVLPEKYSWGEGDNYNY